MIKVLYPQYLLLCLLVIPSSIFYLARIKKLFKIIGDEGKYYIVKLKIRTLLFSLSYICLCIALAGPVYGTKLVALQKKGASIVFVMDVSNSMTIKENDVSRLSTSKYLADFIVQKYTQHSFALVLAKGDGILSVPLTFERSTVLENINRLSPLRLTSSGTNLELGLLKAISSFNNARSNSKIIILFTDGDETKGQILNVAKIILESEITLIIVGVGTKEGGDIAVIDKDGKKINKHSELNEKLLIEMVTLSGNDSMYINSNSFLSLKKMFSMLDSYDGNAEKTILKKEDKVISINFSLCSLILFSIGVIICYETKMV
ncbi:MAG: vWA domain-containing protein [Treponema sp.]